MNVVFTYGRFNPPHRGHKMMIQRIVDLAKKKNKKPVVVVSHSTGSEKNPMNVNEKLRILRGWFPNVLFISSAKNRSIAKITNDFTSTSIMVIGEDRGTSFGFLPFDKVTLSRPSNAPSATKARQSALRGNAKTFKSITGYNLTKNLINRVTKPKSAVRRR